MNCNLVLREANAVVTFAQPMVKFNPPLKTLTQAFLVDHNPKANTVLAIYT